MATRKVRTLIDAAGDTYAAQAGIRLADTPSALYRLLVLTVLLSHRIQADIAVAAAKELFKAGYRTPRRMLEATWQQRVDALGRGHFVRYDESTATRLAEGARFVLHQYGGDLRKLRRDAGGDVTRVKKLLQAVPGIGPAGADIFCREAQAVWPELRPYLDKRSLSGARKAGLATDPAELVRQVPGEQLAQFSAALVRLTQDDKLAERISPAGG